MLQWLTKHTMPPPPATRSRLLLGLLRAVAHTHKSGITHRDIKLANVLVSSAHGALDAVLSDFEMSSDSASPTMTLDARVMGASRTPPAPRRALQLVSLAVAWPLGNAFPTGLGE